MQFPRTFPVRKPEGFVPTVQRWSVRFPEGCHALHVAFFGVQLPVGCTLANSGFDRWEREALQGPNAPVSIDYATYVDEHGATNRVVTAYWVDASDFVAWSARDRARGWWESEDRQQGPCGFWREILNVPTERLETLYWPDYPAALSKGLPIEPTPYCGYFGAMRDRIPRAACDPLDSDGPAQLPKARFADVVAGARYLVSPPHNLAVIRSASFWGNCDEEQRTDYEQKLRDPLANGMQFLREHPEESGCCSMRFQQKLDDAGQLLPETHAHAYFLSLGHMEKWSERHVSHLNIFKAAMNRYRQYGASNQLRTWHEVYVLPRGGQHFEYINCNGGTGLLPYFEAIKI